MVIFVDNVDVLNPCDEQDGDTALMMAARNDLDKSVSILVANGADVNMATKVLEWVLHVFFQWELCVINVN
jgi:hypothetical protein